MGLIKQRGMNQFHQEIHKPIYDDAKVCGKAKIDSGIVNKGKIDK